MWKWLAGKLESHLKKTVVLEVEAYPIEDGCRLILVMPEEALSDVTPKDIADSLNQLTEGTDARVIAIITPWLKVLEFGVGK